MLATAWGVCHFELAEDRTGGGGGRESVILERLGRGEREEELCWSEV